MVLASVDEEAFRKHLVTNTHSELSKSFMVTSVPFQKDSDEHSLEEAARSEFFGSLGEEFAFEKLNDDSHYVVVKSFDPNYQIKIAEDHFCPRVEKEKEPVQEKLPEE
jgi:hypothetical protein